MAGEVRHMPLSMACRFCGRDVAVRGELGWAIVEFREAVQLRPLEFVPQEFYVHMECAKKALLVDST